MVAAEQTEAVIQSVRTNKEILNKKNQMTKKYHSNRLLKQWQ